MNPLYSIQVWPHGWVLAGNANDPRSRGIPMRALSEAQKLFPKDAIIDMAICHHLRTSGHPAAAMCIATPTHALEWRREINASIASLPPEVRWWRGLDVGRSSAAMFAVLCDPYNAYLVDGYHDGATPCDADDFGRCRRLIETFPEWFPRLHKVAEAYPNTKWPQIIARWDELVQAEAAQVNGILGSL